MLFCNYSSPKPTFNHQHINGRRSGYSKQNPSPVQEAYPQHDEIVKFLTDGKLSGVWFAFEDGRSRTFVNMSTWCKPQVLSKGSVSCIEGHGPVFMKLEKRSGSEIEGSRSWTNTNLNWFDIRTDQRSGNFDSPCWTFYQTSSRHFCQSFTCSDQK